MPVTPEQIPARGCDQTHNFRRIGRWSVLFFSVVSVLFLVVMYVFSDQSKSRVFCEFEDPEIGDAYIAGAYDGLLNGWNVAFFHRDKNGNWMGYYLAHESTKWYNAEITREQGKIVVERAGKRMGTYDLSSKLFTHGRSGVTFPIEEGLVTEKHLRDFGVLSAPETRN